MTLTVALLEAGVVVVGLSLLAWKDGIDILTDSYKDAFKVRNQTTNYPQSTFTSSQIIH